MANFQNFAKAISTNYDSMSKGELFKVEDNEDQLWNLYLSSFPEGTNPVFRERTEHDCNCCKHFVRRIGSIVTIKNGIVKSVWDVEGLEYPYNVVAKALSEQVHSKAIQSLFRTKEQGYGAEMTRSLEEGKVINWKHFWSKTDRKHLTNTPEKEIGQANSRMQVFRRGVEEATNEAVSTVLELINSNNLYRGSEFKKQVVQFSQLLKSYKQSNNREVFLWENLSQPSSAFRNSVIGTLVSDLSTGVDLERAVASFEVKVAPTNYKRPKALVTKGMIEQAMTTIRDLGLEESLSRRYATLADISVKDVLFVDNEARGHMKDGIEGLLLEELKPQQPKGQPEPISMEKFLEKVLPSTTSMKLKVSKPENFVSLTAPANGDRGSLFRWGNDFAWSYINEVADSIKERVKKAGGRVRGAKLRVSLAWFNYDDLDIHVIEPNGNRIHYANRSGKLDVDMNAGGGRSREPVENVAWTHPMDGEYKVIVNNFARRENKDLGFDLEVENEGTIQQFSFRDQVGKNQAALSIQVKAGVIQKIVPAKNIMVGQGSGQTVWGVTTGDFVKVQTLTKSPNFWEGFSEGNKHWFFFLDGCKNPESTRGFYNEFLKPELGQHRRVFELLSSKLKCDESDDQLSGLGFSSTRKDKAVVHVEGPRLNKLYEIQF